MGSMWVEKNGRTWRVREKVGDEKITLASGFDTKTAAKERMVLLKADSLRGDALIPRGAEITLNELLDLWWQLYSPAFTRVKTRESIIGVINRYLRILGKYKLRELEERPGLVQRWVNDLSTKGNPKVHKPKPLAPKTVRNAHGLLSQIVDWAISTRRIRSSPCASTVLPEEDPTEMRFLTPAEADRLIAALPAQWRPLVVFLLATGIRWSEALGLRAKHLDVIARKVLIVVKTIEDNRGQFHDEQPKSRRSRRTLSFTTRVAQFLIPLAMVNDDRERRIFLTPRGNLIRHKDFYKIWNAACENAGLKGLRVHDLRHTHVAWLIAGAVHISAISRRLGHKTISVTDTIYGHLLEEVDERLVAALEEAMAVIDFRGDVGETDPAEPPRSPVGPRSTPGQRVGEGGLSGVLN